MGDKLSVLRECHRVLSKGGRIAGYVIHTPPGLDESAERRAAELGPTEVTASGSPEELTTAAGFSVLLSEDVTGAFLETGEAIVRARERLADELREVEGDEAFEEEQAEKCDYLRGIREGLLRRSLVVAVKE